MRQEVPYGSIASFSCVGYGTFIDVAWTVLFSPSILCSRESCNHTALSYSEFISNDNLTINATLKIDTSQLVLDIYTLRCDLQETVPVELDLEESLGQVFSATLVITPPSGILGIIHLS